MASRSLNRVQLIGNLTRDPELRYTPTNKAVVTFTVATSRRWTTNGSKREETEFHRIVAWDKLAEICSQLLVKGSKVYVEGRLHYRNWTTPENVRRDVAEIIITDMVLLAGGKPYEAAPSPAPAATEPSTAGGALDVPTETGDELDVIELPEEDDLPFETSEKKEEAEEEKKAEAEEVKTEEKEKKE